MMKRILVFLMICLLAFPAARAEPTLRVSAYILPEAFTQAHPDLKADLNYEFDEKALQQALITRSMDMDVFRMGTLFIDVANVIDKGFCLDLSGSEIIRSAVERMYPSITRHFVRDGHIYALPQGFYPGVGEEYICNEEVWTELGYTLEDVPKSFPALLDFLEGWIDRVVAEDLPYCVDANFDESVYDAYSYADWLVSSLMNTYIRRAESKEGPLRFNDPDLPALLDRAKRVGEDLFNLCEPTKSSSGNGPGLFEPINLHGDWTHTDWMLDMRLKDDEPSALGSSLDFMAVYAGTEEPELCIELLEALWLEREERLSMGELTTAFLCADAQPVPNPESADNVRFWSNLIAMVEHRLAGDNADITTYLDLTDADYEKEPFQEVADIDTYRSNYKQLWEQSDQQAKEALERYTASLEYAKAHVWYMSPEDLAAYRTYVDGFTFQTPSVFQYNTDDWTSYRSLLSQFTHGSISSQQLLQQLDSIAEMISLEQQ